VPATLVRPSGRVQTLLALLVVVAAALLLAGCGSSSGTAAAPGSPGVADSAGLAPAAPTTDLETIAVADLPAEGIDTLRLIAEGGPFPYSKDGSTFQNREGILPPQPKGFYEEYTVETPGSDDRGARRIVAGDDGSRFYTDDHYDSFREVVSGEAS
jgi:ribonuclease T1